MRLDAHIFEEVKCRIKTVESRLLDDKRGKVSIGDIITFYKRLDSKENVSVEVVDISIFDSWKELVNDISLEKFGPRFNSKEELIKSGCAYSEEGIKKLKHVAFGIKLI